MKHIKVLLIDDDEDDYILTKDVFRNLPSKYSLSWVNSFEKGLSAIRKKEFDVYLLDYRLGNGNGIELLSEAINSGCLQPIIMLTGKGSPEIDEKAMELGAADYLVKDDLEASLVERSIRYSINQMNILQKLQASEVKYRTIFEQAIDPILVMDQAGLIIDLNPGGLKFFGYSKEEVVRHEGHMLFKNHEDAATFFMQLENTGLLNDFECTMQTKDGQEYFCALSAFIHTDMLNVSEVYHTMIKDLSQRKNNEVKSVNLGKMDVSEHIAKGLSEKMRDPLSTINLALDEIAAEEAIISNESAQACIEIVKGNCDTINQLVRNLITSTDTHTMNVQRHDINELVNEAIADAEELIEGQHVQLTKQLLNTDEEVLADKPKLKKAIVNVIQNSLEAINGFPKLIHVGTAIKNGILEIGIKDNGTGIDSENVSKIFEPFFTTKMRAVGLGLTHAQRILMSHNGFIKVESLEKGTLLTMQVPQDQESQS
jgi:PAS domain S-box-containing protein